MHFKVPGATIREVSNTFISEFVNQFGSVDLELVHTTLYKLAMS